MTGSGQDWRWLYGYLLGCLDCAVGGVIRRPRGVTKMLGLEVGLVFWSAYVLIVFLDPASGHGHTPAAP